MLYRGVRNLVVSCPDESAHLDGPEGASGDYYFKHHGRRHGAYVDENAPDRQNAVSFPKGIDHALLWHSSQ